MRTLIVVAAVGFVGLAPSAAPAQTYGDPQSLVEYWYRTYLRREPDYSASVWVGTLQKGSPPDEVLAGILTSPEYYRIGGSTPAGFVTQLYSDLFGRRPTPRELNYWAGRIYTEEDRRTVAEEVLRQNPGVWVGSGAAVAPPATTVTPPVVVTPGIRSPWYRNWERDRRWDWHRHHDIHDYRRAETYRDEHHR
jgi:hypothetical protein